MNFANRDRDPAIGVAICHPWATVAQEDPKRLGGNGGYLSLSSTLS
jgi:hypothetical protein